MSEDKEQFKENTSISSNRSKSKSKSKRRNKKCKDTRVGEGEDLARTAVDQFKELKLDFKSCKGELSISTREDVGNPAKGISKTGNVGYSDVGGLNTSSGTAAMSRKIRRKKKLKLPVTPLWEGSESVVRDLNCSDLASDPMMRVSGPVTMIPASPCTR